MHNQLQKAIELAKKTGDKVIVFDNPQSENAYVVVPFDDYNKIVTSLNIKNEEVCVKDDYLTQDQMIDNINQEMAEWKNSHDFNISENKDRDQEDTGFYNHSNSLNEENKNQIHSVDENLIKKDNEFNEYEERHLGDKHRKGSGSWNIPNIRKNDAEEVVDDEEERQYLEEIPF